MQFCTEIVIHKPVAKVIELFDSQDHLYKWQPFLKGLKVLAGTPGQPGARTKLIYDYNGKDIEMVETVIRKDLPAEFSATYDTKEVNNWVSNAFTPLEKGSTRWTMDSEFKFSGLMALMAVFMKRSMRRQTMKDMQAFKNFVEAEG